MPADRASGIATTSSVIASAGPEQFGKGQNLGVARAIYTIAMCRYQLQNLLLAQAVARELIVGDRIDGDGGGRQPIPQRLLPRSLRAETGSLQLQTSGNTHAIHQCSAFFARAAEREQTTEGNGLHIRDVR